MDDQPQVRSALRLLLQVKLGAATVGETGDLEQALELVGVEQPDLVLLDWELPAQGGGAALSELRTVCPGLAVIALSSKPEARRDALAVGVDSMPHSQVHRHHCFPVSTENHQEYSYHQKEYLLV